MTFDKKEDSSTWLSCSLKNDEPDSSFTDDENVERQDQLHKLRSQIRNGTYRPSIGEIAINLVKGTMAPESFQ